MRIPILDTNGYVVNIVVADENYVPPKGFTKGALGGNIGSRWTGISYEYPPQEEEEIVVPQSVTPFQAYTQLQRVGLLELVENYMALAPIEAQIAWEKAISFERTSPFLIQLSKELGLSDSQVDQLFIEASKI